MSRFGSIGATASHTALVASLSLGAAAMAPFAAQGQTTGAATADPAVQAQPEGVYRVPEVRVEGARPSNALQAPTGISRLPGTVQDTPQTIRTVTPEVMEQQNVTSLEQALRNVPGVTATIGEGNGGVTGDQFRIRGFSAQNDVFVDGLRDFGSYQRDTFNVEEVQVLLGPSGFAMGTNTVGGAINSTARTARLGNHIRGVVTGGMGPYARAVADVNRQISDTAAIRLVVMGQQSDVVDRDMQQVSRWGIAPSFAVGLGTDTTFSVDYMHYRDWSSIDGGIPFITPWGQNGRPATEFGLRRANSYNLENDRDNVTVDRLTARLVHRATEWLTIANDTRLTFVDRYTSLTAPVCGGSTTSYSAYIASCSGRYLNGLNTALTYGGGSNAPYHQENWAIQNVSTATARFNTGPLRHELVGGLDIWHESVDRTAYPYLSTAARTSGLFTPEINNNLMLGTGAANNRRETDNDNVALFVNERLWVIPELSVYGGVRWTKYNLDYQAGTPGALPTTDISISDSFWDPRAGVIFEPTPNQTYYFSYSTSSTPPGSLFTTFPAGVNATAATGKPERNTNLEVGAKIGILDNRLGLSAALFQVEKDNAQQQDPNDPTAVIQTSDKQRVRGVELGVTGRITPEWTINAAYTYLDSETTRSTTAANVGKRVQYVPENAASLWTTYEIARDTPWNVLVGGGITWRDKIYANATNTAEVPANFSLDALVSHRINQNVTIAVNGYNLTDETNYGAVFGNRAVVLAGRTVLANLRVEF